MKKFLPATKTAPAESLHEAYCPKCESYTTDINWRGECRECRTEVIYEDEIPVKFTWEERDYWRDPE